MRKYYWIFIVDFLMSMEMINILFYLILPDLNANDFFNLKILFLRHFLSIGKGYSTVL